MNTALSRLALVASVAFPAASCDFTPDDVTKACVTSDHAARLRDVSNSISSAVDGTIQTFASHFDAKDASFVTGKFKLEASAGGYFIGPLTMVQDGNFVAECHEQSPGNIECQGGTISDNVIKHYERIILSPEELFHEGNTQGKSPYSTINVRSDRCEATFQNTHGMSCEDDQDVCATTFATIQARVSQLHKQFVGRLTP